MGTSQAGDTGIVLAGAGAVFGVDFLVDTGRLVLVGVESVQGLLVVY